MGSPKTGGTKPRGMMVVVGVNAALIVALFLVLELSYRIYLDGVKEALIGIINQFVEAPYSNLGRTNWVIHDRELGYRLNPQRDNINRFSVRHGEIEVPKPGEVFRVVVLGDSVPWDRDGFVKIIGESLREKGSFEVINASVPGYTSYQEVLFYKRHLTEISPDLVIWTYCLNDNHKFLHRFDRQGKMLWTEEARRSLGVDSWWYGLISRSYLLTRVHLSLVSRAKTRRDAGKKFAWETQIDFNIAWKDFSWRDFEGYLVELKSILSERHARLIIVMFPYEPQLLLRGDPVDLDHVLKPQKMMKELCARHQVSLLDLYSIFAEEYDLNEKLFRDQIHLNDLGHAVTARAVLQFLEENKLIGN